MTWHLADYNWLSLGRLSVTLVDSAGRRYVPPFHLAVAYAGLGDVDSAFLWLERGHAERGSFMNGVAITWAFDALHGDPRWASLMRRMGVKASLNRQVGGR